MQVEKQSSRAILSTDETDVDRGDLPQEYDRHAPELCCRAPRPTSGDPERLDDPNPPSSQSSISRRAIDEVVSSSQQVDHLGKA